MESCIHSYRCFKYRRYRKMKIRSVAVLGAGAVGSYIIWGVSKCKDIKLGVIAEGERAERLTRNGCMINQETYHPEVWTPEEAKGVDLIIVALKYGALPGALDSLRRSVGEHTTVMSLMNGVDSEELIAAEIGASHVLPSLIKIASHKEGTGYCFNPETTIGIIFGELEAPYYSARVRAIEELFENAGMRYRITEDIEAEIWSKFRLNVSNNLPQAVLGAGVGCYQDSVHMRAISTGLRRELEAVAEAKGIDLSKADTSSNHGSAVPPTARYSTLQDLDAGRHTEIDMFSGALMRMGKELGIPTPYNEYTYHMIKALEEKNDSAVNANIKVLENVFASIHNKDYDHEVDRKVAKVLFPLYAEMIPAEQRPAFYSTIEKEYKGDYNKFIDAMYDSSIMANQANFDKFIKKPTVKAIKKDLATQYSRAKYESLMSLSSALKAENEKLASLHKTYIRGLEEMKLPVPSYPDANFTIRLTYGNVKPYSPRDGVFYKFYTTTDGIIEKEDPENREFNVPAKLKELIEKKDFGRYAMPNGDMPVCFLSTNDITGGNSGSPVLNENGELIGCAFDGNWESLSGDINFDNDLQRCINLDIRYVLFILEKLGGCGHLINEMTIVE